MAIASPGLLSMASLGDVNGHQNPTWQFNEVADDGATPVLSAAS